MAPDRPPTPRHHPVFGVRLPTGFLHHILNQVYPASTVLSSSQLPSGSSYNNRLYHVVIDHGLEANHGFHGRQELILKLNGLPFKADKVHNEVACLRLMELHCPQLPVPRLRAWSGDGLRFTRVHPDGSNCDEGKIPEIADGDNYFTGWVLMTRIPGESLVADQLDEPTMVTVAKQLADMVACWRRCVPASQHGGNLVLCTGAFAERAHISLARQFDGVGFPPAMARGVVGIPLNSLARRRVSSTIAEYYAMRLESALHILANKSVCAPNRHLVEVVRPFMDQVLPRLGLDPGLNPAADGNEEGRFVFTHGDLAPRNILVSGNPPTITGIVDFEFAGFFPAAQEFVQEHGGNGGDWPKAAYKIFLERLEEMDVKTPLSGLGNNLWRRTMSLERLIENIVPWWLPGSCTGGELHDALQEAERLVMEEIHTLGENGLTP